MLAAPFPPAGITIGFGAYGVAGYTQENPHQGVDWSSYRLGAYHLPIRASGLFIVRFNGRSTTAGPREGLPSAAHGNSIALYYPAEGITVHYSHRLRADGPVEGEWGGLGDYLGQVGNTGMSTGDHLHMDVWRNGKRVNPALYFDLDAVVGERPAAAGEVPFIPELETEDEMRFLFQIDPKTDGRWVVANYRDGTYWRLWNSYHLDRARDDKGIVELEGPQPPDAIIGLVDVAAPVQVQQVQT